MRSTALYALAIAPAPPVLDATLFGLTTNQALVVLFVLLPFALAALILPLVAWRTSGAPKPKLTSEILAEGVPGQAEILAVRPLGGILEMKPMVRFNLRITIESDEDPFEMEVFQSFPRSVASGFRRGESIAVRVIPDRSAAAVVWSETNMAW